MKRIRDEYELPDDDEPEEGYVGALLRKERRSYTKLYVALAFVALVAVGVAGVAFVSVHERQDDFCVSCHTPPEQAYLDRANSAVGGALALDLASYHYQQIRGKGDSIQCISCHEGDGSLGHVIDKRLMSAGHLVRWLAGRHDPAVEKARLSVPHLSNDGCVACHQDKLLLAGMANHHHNMLPASYQVWKNGGRLIPPKDATDVQAIIAAGLVRYDTSVQCSDCHQTHRSLETTLYIDAPAAESACVVCHTQVGQGPDQVKIDLEP